MSAEFFLLEVVAAGCTATAVAGEMESVPVAASLVG